MCVWRGPCAFLFASRATFLRSNLFSCQGAIAPEKMVKDSSNWTPVSFCCLALLLLATSDVSIDMYQASQNILTSQQHPTHRLAFYTYLSTFAAEEKANGFCIAPDAGQRLRPTVSSFQFTLHLVIACAVQNIIIFIIYSTINNVSMRLLIRSKLCIKPSTGFSQVCEGWAKL